MRFKKIYVEITNICNKNCSFCTKDKIPKKEMTLEEFEVILKKIKKYTNYIYLHVKGEPLSHSKFTSILKLCNDYKMFVNITTNGTYLPEYTNEIIKYENIKQINISLQSYNEKDNIKEIISSVNRILENTDINIVYRFWALKNNKLKDIDLKLVDEIISDLKEKNNLKNKIINESNIKIRQNNYINKDSLFTWPKDSNIKTKETFCYGLKTHIGILSNGTVIPCCLDSEGNINLGNIFNEELTDILNKERTQNIIENFKNNKCSEKLCQSCTYRLKL